MKDAKKIRSISKLLGELQMLNTLYSKDGCTVYFDYEGVLELLQRSVDIINESAMAARPIDLPEDIPWCENMDFEEIDPYVYTGDMSEVDFIRMQKLMGF